MKKLIVILIIISLFFTTSFAGAITNEKNEQEHNVTNDLLRIFTIDIGWFKTENQNPSGIISAPENIRIEDGMYPIVINWDATAFLVENNGDIYSTTFTIIVNTLNSQNVFSWTESTWPGNVDLSNELLNIVQVFSPGDAGKTHSVYISLGIIYNNNDDIFQIHKTVNLTLGKVKAKNSFHPINPFVQWFFEIYSVFNKMFLFNIS